MNEAVYRSPKWLRNFVDYEINTGEDIKGKPSKRRQKQIDFEESEKRRIAEEERLQREYQKRQEEKQRQERIEKEKKDQFESLFGTIIIYIQANYKDCKITVPENNKLIIKSKSLKFNNKFDLDFEVTLLNEYRLPKFDVHIVFNNEYYDYTVSGLNYVDFKNFILNTIYPYWQYYGKKEQKSKQNSKQQKTDYGYSSSKQKAKEPEESEDVKNKRRRYKLLKDTLDGYQRQLKKIEDWERANPGKKHPDNREIVLNQIKVVQDKINLMKSAYQFESHTYSNIKSYEIY